MSTGPTGQRRGRGARERILAAAAELFRSRGINNTGMDELCSVAQVSKRTIYQHFGSKDQLIAAYLDDQLETGEPQRSDLTPREQLLAEFDPVSASELTPLCPFIGAAVEVTDVGHPARVTAAGYKRSVAHRLAELAREAGARDPDELGEQLALLLDGASTRTHVLGVDAWATAKGIAAQLIDQVVPQPART